MSYHSIIAGLDRVWNLQETTGTTLAEAGGGPNATTPVSVAGRLATGPTAWLPSAVSLSGTNHYISLPSTPLSGAFTVGAWARRTGDSSASNAAIFAHTSLNRWLLLSPNETEMFTRVVYNGAGLRKLHGITDSEWNHFCWRRNADSTVDLIVNGVQIHTDIFDGGGESGNTEFNRLGQGDGANHALVGDLSQAFIHNDAVPTADVLTIVQGDQATSGKRRRLIQQFITQAA